MEDTAIAIESAVSGRRRRRLRGRPKVAIILSKVRGAWQEARAIELAEALVEGGASCGRDVDVVLAPLGPAIEELRGPLHDASKTLRVRPHQWRLVDADESRRAAAYAGVAGVVARQHLVPDDGIRQFLDCDLWILVDPRLSAPLLPIRPCLLVLDDWLHHAAGVLSAAETRLLADTVASSLVAVSSDWMHHEASAFHGLDEARIVRLPRLPLTELRGERALPRATPGHFVWFVHPERFDGLPAACEAVRRAVRRCGGRFVCRIVPLEPAVGGGESTSVPEEVRRLADDESLEGRVVVAPQPADSVESIAAEIDSAAFVWHPSPADDGRLLVAEAMRSGAGCIVADTPPNREIAAWLDPAGSIKGIEWIDPFDAVSIAEMLASDVGRTASPSGFGPTPVAIDRGDAEAWWSAIERLL